MGNPPADIVSDHPQDPDRAVPHGEDDLAELRRLLLGRERAEIEAIKARLDELGLDVDDLSDILPDAIVARSKRDGQLGKALAPTVEAAITDSVKRRPQALADAIFPILGPAIRKSIAQAMSGLVETLNTAIEHSLTWRGFQWRLEAWRAGVPFGQIVMRHTLLYAVEQVYLIHRETGLLLLHKSANAVAQHDPDLVSSMMTAIKEFAADSFGTAGDRSGLGSFTVGDLTVWVEQGPHAMLAAVLRGHPPNELHAVFQDALETIHLQCADELVAYDGDTSALESATPMLEGCLRVQLRGRERSGVSPALLAIALVVVLALGTWGFFTIRAERRWDRLLQALRAEPGLVVVDAVRRDGVYRLSGLRDAQAVDPGILVAAARVRDVEANWEPYVSLHPAMVVRRAQAMLDAPASVTLHASTDTLFASGSANGEWIARARARATSIPGIRSLETSGLENTDARALVDSLEALRITFPAGSAALGPEQLAAVRAAAATIRSLVAIVDGGGVLVLVDGRTDSTGSDAANTALSRARADVVRSALISAGTAPATVRAEGLGSRDPLPGSAGDGVSLNRSATFRVRLDPATPPPR